MSPTKNIQQQMNIFKMSINSHNNYILPIIVHLKNTKTLNLHPVIPPFSKYWMLNWVEAKILPIITIVLSSQIIFQRYCNSSRNFKVKYSQGDCKY